MIDAERGEHQGSSAFNHVSFFCFLSFFLLHSSSQYPVCRCVQAYTYVRLFAVVFISQHSYVYDTMLWLFFFFTSTGWFFSCISMYHNEAFLNRGRSSSIPPSPTQVSSMNVRHICAFSGLSSCRRNHCFFGMPPADLTTCSCYFFPWLLPRCRQLCWKFKV